jgi:hypothetical protein
MTKHVSMHDSLDGKLVLLASFQFENGRVVAVYHDAGYGRDIEQNGIGAMVGSDFKILRPSDGKPFYDALDAVYSQSTLMEVSASDSPAP